MGRKCSIVLCEIIKFGNLAASCSVDYLLCAFDFSTISFPCPKTLHTNECVLTRGFQKSRCYLATPHYDEAMH